MGKQEAGQGDIKDGGAGLIVTVEDEGTGLDDGVEDGGAGLSYEVEDAEAGAQLPGDGRGRREEGRSRHARPGRCREQGRGPTQTNQGLGDGGVQTVRRPRGPHPGRPAPADRQRRHHRYKPGGARNGDVTSSGDVIHDGLHHIADGRKEADSDNDIHGDFHRGLLAREPTKQCAKKKTRELDRGRGRRRRGGGGQILWGPDDRTVKLSQMFNTSTVNVCQ